MIPPLPPAFLDRPITHRALHDGNVTRPENSLAAIRAAVEAGYGIEVDIQPSSDGQAMVFHDYTLDRLTNAAGPVSARTASALENIHLLGGAEGIPTLRTCLAEIAGRVPLLIEIKDQDGSFGPNVGALETAVADDLAGYVGDVAVMSFNPHAVAAMADCAPGIARGLTTANFDEADLPEARRAMLTGMSMFEAAGAAFISHDRADLASPHVAALKARGTPILCWTVRSRAQESDARRVADQITFEGYVPDA